MQSYLARRLLAAGLTLLGLSMLIFFLGTRTGDPSVRLASGGLLPGEEPSAQQIAAIRHELGLDRPLPERYLRWLAAAAHGDLGRSVFTGRDVGDMIGVALPTTAHLAVLAMVMIVVLAVPMGTVAAMFHRRWPDGLLRMLSLAGASVPGFFLAYILVFFAAVRLHLFPVAGIAAPRSFVLPALTLAVGPAALVSRLLRSSLLEVLGESYVGTARAKGLAPNAVVIRHALRNAALPVMTVLGGVFARLLEGTVIVEIVFSIPGIGRLTYDSVALADYPMVQGTVLLAGFAFVVMNLVVDLTYSAVDPQVRLGATS